MSRSHLAYVVELGPSTTGATKMTSSVPSTTQHNKQSNKYGEQDNELNLPGDTNNDDVSKQLAELM